MDIRFTAGQVIAGRYRLDRELGTGAMGVVMAATHLDLDREVAIKFMLPEATAIPGAIDRFLREAQAAVKLKSEHVCHVLDFGRIDGTPYIVMEHLDGEDLYDHLTRSGPLPVSSAASLVMQACEAMTEAHALGIVHRDLKPQNLFLTRKGDGTVVLKVLDFGVAKATTTGVAATQTSALIGSPAYMSPEQLRSAKHVDGRSDLWALGVILYQLTSGQLPFAGDTVWAVAARVMDDEPTPLSALCGALPAGFEALVTRCLAKDRDQRVATAMELHRALAPFADAVVTRPAAQMRVVEARSPGTLGGSITTLGGAAAQSLSDPVTAKPRSGRVMALVVAATVAVGLAVAIVVVPRSSDAPSAAAPAAVLPAAAPVQPVTIPPAAVDASPQVVVAAPDAGVEITAPPVAVDAGARTVRRSSGSKRTTPTKVEKPADKPAAVEVAPKKYDPLVNRTREEQ